MEQRPVRLAPGILAPRHLTGVAGEVAPADAVVLADLRTAQAAKERLHHVRADAVVHEGDAVIDAAHLVTNVQVIPA